MNQTYTMAQNGYRRILPSTEFQSITDMQLTANGEMHIAATHFVYRLNSAGEITRQTLVKEGSYSELRAAIPQPDGSDLLLLHTLELTGPGRLIYFRLTASGNLTGRKEIPATDVHDYIRMKKISADRLLVTYKKKNGIDEHVVWGMCLNAAGDILWEKRLTGPMYNYYSVLEDNDGIELMYRKQGEEGASLVRISPEGQLQTMDFEFSANITAADHLNEFIKLPDGSYMLTGIRIYRSVKKDDIVLVKTTADGKETALRRWDIQMGDWAHHLHATTDGVLLLGSSGRGHSGDIKQGELLVMKTDYSGNELWRRAFASPIADMGYFIRALNGQIYLTARMSSTGSSLSTPVAMQLDALGNLPDNFPYALAQTSEIKTWNTGMDDAIQILEDAIAGANNNIILGINRLNHENDSWIPRVVACKTNGELSWTLNLPENEGEIKVLSRVGPNDNLVITELRDIFANLYHVTQFNDDGQTGWTYETGASHMRAAIRTGDGGYLLLGDVDISFVNYDVQLTKLDEKGNQLWQKTIGVHGKWELPRCITETPEGDFIIAGTSLKEFDEISILYALRVSREGQVQWQRELGTGIVEENAFTIVPTADGHYMVGGFYHTQPLENRNIMLAKFDGAGQLITKNSFDLHLHDEIRSMLPMANGGFVAAGNTAGYQWGTWQQRGFIMQLTDRGIPAKTTYYGAAGHHLSFQKLLVTSGNDTLIVGTHKPFFGHARPVYVKVQTSYAEPPPPVSTDLFIFPNPSPGSSKLRWVSPYEGPVKIQVFNASGQSCFSAIDYKTAVVYQYELPLLADQPGLYFVRVEIANVVRTLKWLRVR